MSHWQKRTLGLRLRSSSTSTNGSSGSFPRLGEKIWRPKFLVRAAFDITGFLATADPLFIFHLFCLCLITPGFTQLITCLLYNHLFPMLCLWVIVDCNSVRLCGLVMLLCKFVFLSKVCWLLLSAVLRLTIYTSFTQDHNNILMKKYCTAVLSYKCNTSEYLSIKYISSWGIFPTVARL
jgi:hypothetical protein